MASRHEYDLEEKLRGRLQLFKKKAREAGLDFIITCTARDIREQMALYAQGRMKLEFVNNLRAMAGIYEIGEAENKRKVTWTLRSRHVVDMSKGEKATAFDVVLRKVGAGVHWDVKVDVNDNDIPDYEELGQIGKKCGLVWGGDFKNRAGEPRPDRPHFQ